MTSRAAGEHALLERVHRLAEALPEASVAAICAALTASADRDWAGRRSAVVQAVSHPRARAAADRLVEHWQAESPDTAPAALALALRTASIGAARQRAEHSLDLVWTGPGTYEIPLRHTSQALLDVIRAARERLTIVSFAITRVPQRRAGVVADDDLLFVSSANLTDAAMELNIELGTLIRGGPVPGKVQRHFDALIADGHLTQA